MNICDTKINSLLYGNDIVLVTSSAQQLQNVLGTCERRSRDHKYEFAPEKCEVAPPIRGNLPTVSEVIRTNLEGGGQV